MVTLEKIREDIKPLYEKDSSLNYIDVNADSIEEALSDAAVQLNTTVVSLEYEVLESGFAGFFGLMKKPWHLRVYENEKSVQKKKKKSSIDIVIEDDAMEQSVSMDKDGMFFVRRFGSEVFLKVVLPVANGKPVDVIEAMRHLENSQILELEREHVKEMLTKGTGLEYEPIGHYEHNQSHDATFYVDISSDEMTASIMAQKPEKDGADIERENILRMLSTQQVTFGVSDQKIDEFIDNPVYGIPFVVAEGLHALDGKDAYIAYNFETDPKKLRPRADEKGQINYKKISTIQNVVAGQPLAQKIPAERGKAGKTVFGRYLEAKNGKDIPFPLGKNVSVDSDGTTIIADTNGQVLLAGTKITVEPILELAEVSIKTSSIIHTGTVIVHGNVEDGYDISASGNIEVGGTVGNCTLKADGDIIVSLGVRGKDSGSITAGKSLWAKFIENSTVEVEENVVVTDGIINSNVTANKRIIVNGKRAAIVGGELFATEEIRAKTIGSSGGNETILRVGYDPRAKRRLDDLMDMRALSEKKSEEISLDLTNLENQKKVRNHLSPEKEEKLTELNGTKKQLLSQIEAMTKEIEEIQAHLRELRVVGKVSAMDKVYAGVKVWVRDVKDDIKNDVRAVTFFFENGFIRHGKYEEPDEKDKELVPDGYSTN